MSSEQLLRVWEGAKGSPFAPYIGKENQFTVGFILLSTAFLLSIVFALNRSIATLPTIGIPASLAFGFGVLYMTCAVGVYV